MRPPLLRDRQHDLRDTVSSHLASEAVDQGTVDEPTDDRNDEDEPPSQRRK